MVNKSYEKHSIPSQSIFLYRIVLMLISIITKISSEINSLEQLPYGVIS